MLMVSWVVDLAPQWIRTVKLQKKSYAADNPTLYLLFTNSLQSYHSCIYLYRNGECPVGRSAIRASLVPKAALRDAPRLTTGDLELN